MITGKKKLLIVSNNLAIGGVQKSLINLLDEIKDLYEITLYIFSYSGEYKNCVPKQVKIIEGSLLIRLLGLTQKQAKKEGFWLYLIRMIAVLYSKVFGNHLPIKLLVKSQEKLSGYDVAISYIQNFVENVLAGGCNEFVLDRTDAKRKITFLHCDYLNYGGNTRRNREVIKRFDKIAAVSEGCLRSFNQAVPEIAQKTHCVYNCHSYADYIDMANDRSVEYSRDYLNIVTVARLSPEKGILRGLEAMNRIIKDGRKICWHIVGDGNQREDIEERIRLYNISDYIKLYGNQDNPYRYMKNADALLLPSFNEAAPLVFGEAKCIGLPIISTNTSSAKEMVVEVIEGFVCDNSELSLYEVLKSVVDNPKVLDTGKEYLQRQNYTNEKALLQFQNLINDWN